MPKENYKEILEKRRKADRERLRKWRAKKKIEQENKK